MSTYRDFWEPAEPNGESVSSRTEKKFLGKLFVTTSDFPDGKICFTNDVKAPLLGNASMQKKITAELVSQIDFFIKKYKIKQSSLVLVAGIGNENATADSLGCRVCDGIYATSHYYGNSFEKTGNLACVKCGIAGITGIESFDHLSALCEKLKPTLIIAVDTLAANTARRLSSAIQISDKGISPGNGVGNKKTEMSSYTLSAPVVAIGVPLVIFAKKLLAEYVGETSFPAETTSEITELVVTAKEIDFLVKDYAKIISESINDAIHNLSET